MIRPENAKLPGDTWNDLRRLKTAATGFLDLEEVSAGVLG